MSIARLGAVLALAIAATSCSSSGRPHSGSSNTPCTAALAKPANTVVITGSTINPTCVKVARGAGLAIVNTGASPVRGSMKPPSTASIVVNLPNKNAVYPFTAKTAGAYVFTCTGCANSLHVFVS